MCVKHFYIISSRLSLDCPRTNDILFLPLTAGMLTLSTHLLRSFVPTWRNINPIETNRSEAEAEESHCPPTPDASQCGSCRIVCEYIIHCVWATGFASRNGECIRDAWYSARLLSLNDASNSIEFSRWHTPVKLYDRNRPDLVQSSISKVFITPSTFDVTHFYCGFIVCVEI